MSAVPTAADAGVLPFNRGDGDHQQEHVANGFGLVGVSIPLNAAAANLRADFEWFV